MTHSVTYLLERASDLMESQEESFSIDSMKRFAWYMEKIELLITRIKEHNQIAKDRREALYKAYQEALEKIEGDRIRETTMFVNDLKHLYHLYGQQAIAFANQHLDTLKGKSFKVGRSQIGYRKNPSRLQVIDKKEAIDWLWANGMESMISIEESIKVRDLSEYVKQTNTLPNGIVRTDESEEFYMSVNSENLLDIVQTEESVNE